MIQLEPLGEGQTLVFQQQAVDHEFRYQLHRVSGDGRQGAYGVRSVGGRSALLGLFLSLP